MISFSSAENKALDSLNAVLKTLPEDTNRVNTLLNLSDQYNSMADYGQMSAMASDALILSEKLDFKRGMASAHFNKGMVAYYKSDFPLTLGEYYSALKIYKEIDDLKGLADLYSNIGIIYSLQGIYPEALKNMFEGLKMREQLGNKGSIAKSYSNIGGMYRMIGEYQKALQYHFKALKIQQEMGTKISIAKSYTNIGNVYREQGDLNKALRYNLEAYNLNDEIKNKDGVAKAGHNLGEIYMLLGIKLKEGGAAGDTVKKNFDLAQSYFTPSLKLSLENNDKYTDAANYLDLGLLKLKQNKASEAQAYLIKSLNLNIETNNRDFIKESYYRLAMADSAMGNYKGAYENHKMFTLYQDSLFNEENTKKITRQQMQYDFNKKEEIARDEQEKKDIISTHQLQTQKKITILFIIISVIMLVAGFLFYSRNKLLRKAESQAAELTRLNEIEAIRGRISRDLHDDIGSTLSSINILSQLDEKDLVKREAALQKIGERSSKMMEAMDDIVWAVNPVNDSLDNMVVRMREYAAEMLESKNIDYHFNVSENLADLKLDMEKRRDLFLIYKEAVNNLAKYADCKLAEINLLLNQNKICMEVKDDGKGFDVTKTNGGNGLVNLKRRSENLKAELSLNSAAGKGTTIVLVMPIT